jgi:RNA polymerase sigma-70 factor (ECF subfamily)
MAIDRQRLEIEQEHNLLAAAQAGDEGAFGCLARRHRAGLERYCQLMLGCPYEAHEAVQETLLRGWRGLERVAPSTSARIWLYRLATHVCLDDREGTDESGGSRRSDVTEDRDR